MRMTPEEICSSKFLNYNQKVLKWFSDVSPKITSIDAKEHLGIIRLSAKVHILRKKHDIRMKWLYQKDSAGTTHKLGEYEYVGPLDG